MWRSGRSSGARLADVLRSEKEFYVLLVNSVSKREFCLLKGHYNTKHALGSTILLYYDTIMLLHTHTHIHRQSVKLGHAHERHCDPNHREQHGVARHEAQLHNGAASARDVGVTTDRNSPSARRPMVQRCWWK